MTARARILALVALAACGSPSAGSDGGPPPDAEPGGPCDHAGQVDMRACGLNGRGNQSRTCDGVDWGPWGSCFDPDECRDGTSEQEACGSGQRTRTCSDGAWSEWTGCPAIWRSVSVGGGTVCGVHTDDTLECWGAQLAGDPPSGTVSQVSVSLGAAVDADTFEVAAELGCAVRTTGALACWGDGTFAQDLPPAGTYTAVSTGGATACARRSDGFVACWGADDAGQATAPDVALSAVSVGPSYPIFLEAGGLATGAAVCGLRGNRRLLCWGNDLFGVVTAAPAGEFVSVSVAETHACAVDTGGAIQCWGDEPPAPSGGGFAEVVTSSRITCGRHDDGTVDCWYAHQGTHHSGTPAGAFGQIAADFAGCGVRTDGTAIVCWDAFTTDMCRDDRVEALEGENVCGGCGPLQRDLAETCTCGGTFRCEADFDSDAYGFGTCDDGDNAANVAADLGATDDGNDAWLTTTTTLDVDDEDWFRVDVDDVILGFLEPEFMVETEAGRRYQLCAYYVPTGRDPVGDCATTGDADPFYPLSANGVAACCAITDAAGAARVPLLVGGLSDDSGTAYFRLFYLDGPDDCADANLSYRF